MTKRRINIQLFAEEPIIKTTDDLEKKGQENTESGETEAEKTDEKDNKINALEEKIKKLEEQNKKLLVANNDLYAKCLSYKENKGQGDEKVIDKLLKNI